MFIEGLPGTASVIELVSFGELPFFVSSGYFT